MRNPWLNIPLADYEGHMNAPGVEQLEVVADLFGDALRICRPESVAVLGVAGGNGLDRIDTAVTRRIVGVDIHSEYLATARTRYPDLPLTLICADLSQKPVPTEPVELVHAGLIFEHAGTVPALGHAADLVGRGGFLSVVLQLPSMSTAGVAPSNFVSMRSLSGHFQFVDVDALRAALVALGFGLLEEERRDVPGGKAFWMGVFRRGPA